MVRKFTILKCTIQLFLVYSQNCVTVTTNSGTFKSQPHRIHRSSHCPPLTTTHLLSVSADLLSISSKSIKGSETK